MRPKLDKETTLKIKNDYDKYKAKDLAIKYSCSISQVYDVKKKFKNEIGYNLNQVCDINTVQEQMLLGGILGDGRFKKNGKYNVLYSECHAIDEQEYLEYKFNNFGDLTKDTVIYDKNINNNSSDAKEFTTKTTPSLIPYYKLSKDIDKTIPKLDELGLLIDLLDDGWWAKYRTNSGNGNLNITAYQYTEQQRQLLIKQWDVVTGVKFHEVGIKRVDLSASSSQNLKLTKLALKYFPRDLDIMKKKFGDAIKYYNL